MTTEIRRKEKNRSYFIIFFLAEVDVYWIWRIRSYVRTKHASRRDSITNDLKYMYKRYERQQLMHFWIIFFFRLLLLHECRTMFLKCRQPTKISTSLHLFIYVYIIYIYICIYISLWLILKNSSHLLLYSVIYK